MKKGIIRLILVAVIVLLAVKLCSDNFGGVISLPGSGGSSSGSGSGSGESGGWFGPKEQTGGSSTNSNGDIDIEDLERELGIGKNKGRTTTTTTTTTTPSSTTSSTTPLTFKGIPMKGTLSSFGTELTKAGFRSAGNGTYTGDFAGYSGCKVTPSGINSVQDVRVDFPVISDWDALEKAYDSLQASLTEKYGMEPSTSPNSNVAVYDVPGGTITLDADVKDRSSWHVILTYSNASTITLPTSSGRNPIDDL